MISTGTQKGKFKLLVRKFRGYLNDEMVSAETTTIGLLEGLWHATANNAPRGDIGKLSDALIAELAGWRGVPETFIQILVESNWLDRSKKYRLIVHDWHEHAPNYIKGMIARKNCGFAMPDNGHSYDPKEAYQGSEPGIGTKDADLGSQPPNQTKPNQTTPDHTSKETEASAIADRFTKFLEAYPRVNGRLGGRDEAWEVWAMLAPKEETVQKILQCLATFTRSDEWKRDGGRFIPRPAKWLEERPWTESQDPLIDGLEDPVASFKRRHLNDA